MDKKYKLLHDDTVVIGGKTLYRIKALKDFGNVRKGEKGGCIERYENLSQGGNAWVYRDARVFGDARVSEDAQVHGTARVFGDAWVYGNAQVYENAWVFEDAQVHGTARVYGNARVYENAWVYGNAWVSGNARVYGLAEVKGEANIRYLSDLLMFYPIGSEDACLTAYAGKKEPYVTRGCFEGTLAEFETAVDKTHGDNTYAQEYKLAIELIKVRFGVKSEVSNEPN